MSHDNPSPSVLKRLYLLAKPYWPMFIIVFLGNAAYSSVDSYSMYLFKPILDKGFVHKDIAFLKFLPILVIILFLMRGIAGFISTYAIGWIGRRVVLSMREILFAKYLRLPAAYFDQSTSGSLVSKMTFNVEQITEATSSAVVSLLRNGTFVIGLLVVMFTTSWRFSLFILLVMPLVAFVTTTVSRRFKKLARNIQGGMGGITQITEESVSAYKEIRIFGAQEQETKKFYSMILYNFRQEMKMNMTMALNSPIIQLIGSFVLAIILYFALRGGVHEMSAGSFVTLLSSMLAILKPARTLTNINSTIQRAIVAAEDIFRTIDSPDEPDHGTRTLPVPVKGHIQFKDVSFGYLNDRPVLEDFNLEIQPGEMIAFVGRSGAGKTTIVNLLTRFYNPTSGVISIDDHPIHDLTLASSRAPIALVSQHVILFNDTLFRNIAFGATRSSSEEEVIHALKAAYAWEFVSKLPDGIHSRLGDNGLNLSGGQRQRIAIARAILLKAPILILDEATSALDTESERAIQSAIEGLRGTCTRIIIAHRLSTVQGADRIVVLDQGKVIETGTHQSLIAQSGLYADLVSKQML